MGRRACVLGVSPTYHLSLPRGGRRQARSWRLGKLGELGDGFGPEGVEKLHVNGGARNIGEVCIRVRVRHNRLGRTCHPHGDLRRCGTLDCAAGIKLDDALHSAQLRRLLHQLGNMRAHTNLRYGQINPNI